MLCSPFLHCVYQVKTWKQVNGKIFIAKKKICSQMWAVVNTFFKTKNKNVITPFYGWGSTTSRLEPVCFWGDNLLFTTKFPEIIDTHFINLWRMKGWVDLGATQWFWTWEPWSKSTGIKKYFCDKKLFCGNVCLPH